MRRFSVKESGKQNVLFHPVIVQSFSFPWFTVGNACRASFPTVSGSNPTTHCRTPVGTLVLLHNSHTVWKKQFAMQLISYFMIV